MIESGIGRTKRAEARQGRCKARWSPETQHGEMREPGTPLTPVDADPLEPGGQVGRERGGTPAEVLEHEHPDGARLAIAPRSENGLFRTSSRLAKRRPDRIDLRHVATAEERERDVQVLPWHDA